MHGRAMAQSSFVPLAMSSSYLPASWPVLVAAVAIVFGAGVVRGFAGFGFSALSVAGLALLVPPAQVVPPIFALEVVASIALLREAWRDADRRWLAALVVGNALFIPLGVALLATLPERALRLVIGVLLLVGALAQRGGAVLALAPTRPARLFVGAVSGLVNGLAAIGGIVVAALLGPATLAPAALRATLILLFLFTDVYALACAAVASAIGLHGGASGDTLVGPRTIAWTVVLAPAMLAGIAIGRRAFAGVSPAAFRRRVLDLLLAVAAIAVVRSIVDIGG